MMLECAKIMKKEETSRLQTELDHALKKIQRLENERHYETVTDFETLKFEQQENTDEAIQEPRSQRKVQKGLDRFLSAVSQHLRRYAKTNSEDPSNTTYPNIPQVIAHDDDPTLPVEKVIQAEDISVRGILLSPKSVNKGTQKPSLPPGKSSLKISFH